MLHCGVRENWAYDPEVAESIRQKPTSFWTSPDAKPLDRKRREPGKRLLAFEEQRRTQLSRIPGWFWRLLDEEAEMIRHGWRKWQDETFDEETHGKA